MNYFLALLFSLLLCSSTIRRSRPENDDGRTFFNPLNSRQLCEITCLSRGLVCLGVLEKTVYDGQTEEAKVLSRQYTTFCLQYPEEYNPT